MTSRFMIAAPSSERSSWLQLLLQSFYSTGAVAVLTAGAYLLKLPLATVGFIYLLIVMVISLIWGIWQATFTSLVAVSCLNYFFIPPLLSFSVQDQRDWIALVSFQVAALIVSRLSAREQKIARDANQQRIHMGKLYKLSHGVLLFDLHQPPGPQLVQLIRQVLLADDVAIFDADLIRLDHDGMWSSEQSETAKTTYFLGKNEDDVEFHTMRRVIRSGVAPIGGMAIRGELDPLLADAVASLAAIALERFRSFQKESIAESARQAEQFRVAVLDALAHAFKTPLTVIRTASCGLLELGTLDTSEAELATLIDGEAVNLNQLCTQLLQTAKLETKSLAFHKEPIIISKLVHEVVRSLGGLLKRHTVQVAIEEHPVPIQSDRMLLEMILTQYLDNAAKYSIPETPIEVTARETDTELVLSVHNQGPVIQIQDRERVFERFYRSADARDRAAGAGLGLSIVKKAAEAHQGHVWVTSTESEGTTFFLSMPKDHTGGIHHGVGTYSDR